MTCALIGFAGCASDTTAPSGPAGGGALPGTWVYNLSPAVQNTSVCDFPSLILRVTQTDDALTGTYGTSGAVACLVGGQVYSGSLGSGTITGAASGDSVSILLHPIGLQLSGARDPLGIHGSGDWGVYFT
ncbi:MAG: hypothetical protein ACREOE_11625, partial [Gemmatimonadales bacterium]